MAIICNKKGLYTCPLGALKGLYGSCCCVNAVGTAPLCRPPRQKVMSFAAEIIEISCQRAQSRASSSYVECSRDYRKFTPFGRKSNRILFKISQRQEGNNKFLRLCDFVIDYVGFPTRQRGSNPQPKLHIKCHQSPSKRHAQGREIFQNLIQNLTKADKKQIAANERFCERFSEISHALAWLQPAAETSHQKPSKVIKNNLMNLDEV